LKLPLLFGKSSLIKMAKASKIQIKTQTLEPVSTNPIGGGLEESS
jgi:hypothetical protein